MKKIKPYFTCIAICLLVEFISGFITQGSVNSWYKTIIKPDFTPPNWVFAPVWTLLYLTMGFAWGHINTVNKEKNIIRNANFIFILQLFFNFLWSIIYFGFHNIAFALIDIVLLLLTLSLTIYQFFKISKLSGWLLTPYLLWVLFASFLNFSIWTLNN